MRWETKHQTAKAKADQLAAKMPPKENNSSEKAAVLNIETLKAGMKSVTTVNPEQIMHFAGGASAITVKSQVSTTLGEIYVISDKSGPATSVGGYGPVFFQDMAGFTYCRLANGGVLRRNVIDNEWTVVVEALPLEVLRQQRTTAPESPPEPKLYNRRKFKLGTT